MKPYGINKADWGCCPGHDKYGTTTKESARTRDHARDRPRKKKARQQNKKIINN